MNFVLRWKAPVPFHVLTLLAVFETSTEHNIASTITSYSNQDSGAAFLSFWHAAIKCFQNEMYWSSWILVLFNFSGNYRQYHFFRNVSNTKHQQKCFTFYRSIIIQNINKNVLHFIDRLSYLQDRRRGVLTLPDPLFSTDSFKRSFFSLNHCFIK